MNSLLCSIILGCVMIVSFFIKLDAWCSTCSEDDACDVAVCSGKNCWCEYNKLFRVDGKVLSFVFNKIPRTEPPQAALLDLFSIQVVGCREGRPANSKKLSFLFRLQLATIRRSSICLVSLEPLLRSFCWMWALGKNIDFYCLEWAIYCSSWK